MGKRFWYTYSYSHVEGENFGFGDGMLCYDKCKLNHSDLRNIARAIEGKGEVKNVVIMNINLV